MYIYICVCIIYVYIYIWDKPKNREATRFFPTLRSPAKARDKQAKSDVLDLRSSCWRALRYGEPPGDVKNAGVLQWYPKNIQKTMENQHF